MLLSERLNKLVNILDTIPLNVFLGIDSLCNNPISFIEAVKYAIDVMKKPYEFNSDYTKIRRIENV